MTDTTQSHFTPADMATAAAQGFRDGVAKERARCAAVLMLTNQKLLEGMKDYQTDHIADKAARTLMTSFSEMLMITLDEVNDVHGEATP